VGGGGGGGGGFLGVVGGGLNGRSRGELARLLKRNGVAEVKKLSNSSEGKWESCFCKSQNSGTPCSEVPSALSKAIWELDNGGKSIM